MITAAEAARAAGDVRLRFGDADVDATISEDDDERDRPQHTYETATARLEEIIRRLDSGEAGLRETLDLCKEGRELVEFCAGELDAVGQGLEELRLDELVARLEQRPRRRSRVSLSDAHRATCRCAIEGYALERLQRDVSSDFTRVSTVIRLHGDGEEGIGEDVTYDADDQDALQEAGAGPAARRQLDARRVLRPRRDARPLAAAGAARRRRVLYRRWAYESAALDLALRQAGMSLHEALGREPRPVNFVVSLRLGEPPTLEPIERRASSATRRCSFKLDPSRDWDDELIAALVATGAVDSVDFKGMYVGTVVDQPADPVLYRRVVEALPRRVDRGPEARRRRPSRSSAATTTASPGTRPSTRVDDVEALPFPPQDGQRQAVARSAACARCSRLRLLRGARHRRLRRRPVRARRRPRPDPVPRLALPPGHARTTWRPAATTTSSRPTACRRARCRSQAHPTGFRWG